MPSLARFDPATGECVYYPPRGLTAPDLPDAGAGFQRLLIQALHPDPDGRYLWLGGWYKTGLLRFDTQTLAWKQYFFPEGTYNRINHIASRNANQIWVATDAPLCYSISAPKPSWSIRTRPTILFRGLCGWVILYRKKHPVICGAVWAMRPTRIRFT